MKDYLFYILTVIGIGYFVTQSDLLKPFRMAVSKLNRDLVFPSSWLVNKFDGVINCIYCASFWIGVIVYQVVYLEISVYSVLYPFSAMGSIYVVKNLFSKD